MPRLLTQLISGYGTPGSSQIRTKKLSIALRCWIDRAVHWGTCCIDKLHEMWTVSKARTSSWIQNLLNFHQWIIHIFLRLNILCAITTGTLEILKGTLDFPQKLTYSCIIIYDFDIMLKFSKQHQQRSQYRCDNCKPLLNVILKLISSLNWMKG